MIQEKEKLFEVLISDYTVGPYDKWESRLLNAVDVNDIQHAICSTNFDAKLIATQLKTIVKLRVGVGPNGIHGPEWQRIGFWLESLENGVLKVRWSATGTVGTIGLLSDETIGHKMIHVSKGGIITILQAD
jgi:hypothetical protein